VHGRYSFYRPELGGRRPLRDPDASEDEETDDDHDER